MHTQKLVILAATLASAQLASAATIINPAFDTRADTSASTALNKSDINNLGVGPIDGSNRGFRSYLTFDLTSAPTATSVSLDLFSIDPPFSDESNTATLAQTFTLFSLASDWDGATAYPLGTDLATFDITPTTGNDTQNIAFSNTAALTSAYNNAIGGSLYLGIYSPQGEAAAAGTRSFVFQQSMEDASQPQLTVIPEPSAALISAMGLLALLGRRRRK